jgi:AraC-like DNA-binding protein
MLKESYTIPPDPVAIGGMALRCVWSVEADSSYDVAAGKARRDSARIRPKGGTGLIAVRTLAGAGRVYFRPDQVRAVDAGSLLLIEWELLQRYHCRGDRWHFWWYEFDTVGPVKAPLHRVMAVPVENDERAIHDGILTNLRREDEACRCLACSQFQTLVCLWMTRRTDANRHAKATYDRIQAVIVEMHNRLSGDFPVQQMARMAHLSEPQFRRVFREVTGATPKKFYDRLRLVWAEHMLRTEQKRVHEVADALGYYSPFHFSRVFREHFGYPPSHVRHGQRHRE